MTVDDQANSTRSRPSAQDAILDAAEMLIGKYGPNGVSLRQISTAAGSANHSAVQYHFKNREGLIRGIYQRRLSSLEKKRGALLEDLFRQNRDKDTRLLLDVLLSPIAGEKDFSGQCSYAAFLLGLRMFGELSQWGLYRDLAPITRNVDVLLRASLETMPLELFGRRLVSAVSVFLISVVDWDRQVASGSIGELPARETYLKQALDFAAAGLMAPWD